MNRILSVLATASIFVVGCGQAALPQVATAPAAPAPALAAAPAAPATTDAAKDEIGGEAAPAPAPASRMPGDFVVYRFTGSFRKTPLTLTEKVVARRGALLTIDFAAREGDAAEDLRVTFDEASPSHSEVVRVARLEGGVEKASTPEAYEALMGRTSLSADENEALLGTDDVTVDVGSAQVPAKRTTYRVRVGKKQATLRTLESAAFAWGDVGGELTATSGKVLYRAEVVEAGHDDGAAKAAAMAQ
jgi:hypothetical protein